MAGAAHNHGPITELLSAWRAGSDEARDRLIPLVYADLKRVAARQVRKERTGHTLQPTALVHETFLRLTFNSLPEWKDRAHFFRVAARLMRRILVDHARRRRASKRGGGAWTVSLEDAPAPSTTLAVEIMALDAALEELARIDPRKGEIVELRYFAGLSIEEAAEALDLSAATVKRDWTFARAWLFQRLTTGGAVGSGK